MGQVPGQQGRGRPCLFSCEVPLFSQGPRSRRRHGPGSVRPCELTTSASAKPFPLPHALPPWSQPSDPAHVVPLLEHRRKLLVVEAAKRLQHVISLRAVNRTGKRVVWGSTTHGLGCACKLYCTQNHTFVGIRGPFEAQKVLPQ